MKKFYDPMAEKDFVPAPQEADIQRTVLCGQQYMSTHIPQKTSLLKLFFDQIHYISPFLWAAQFAALILLILAAFTAQDMSCETMRNMMFFLAPLTAVFAVPEFFKDVSCGVLEMEMTCKNSCASVFSIRLILIGFVNITVITLFSSILSFGWGLRFWSVILYGLLPVNLIYIINFFLFRMLKVCGRFSVLSCSVLTSVFVSVVLSKTAAAIQLTEAAWIILCILTSFILLTQCMNEILRISKRQGVLLWNF